MFSYIQYMILKIRPFIDLFYFVKMIDSSLNLSKMHDRIVINKVGDNILRKLL